MDVWAVGEDSDTGIELVAYFDNRELAKELAVREFRSSDEAKEEDYADDYEARKVMKALGFPSQMIKVYNVNRIGFRPKWRNRPDGDLQLAVWKNTGTYGPGWRVTNWLIKKITILSALPGEQE